MNQIYRILAALVLALALGVWPAQAATERKYVQLPEESDSVTIANGASVSGSVDSYGMRLVGLITPATITGTQFTLQATIDGGSTWTNVYDAAGNEYVITVGASRYIPLDPAATAGLKVFRLRSGTAVTPVNQGQTTVISLYFRSL